MTGRSTQEYGAPLSTPKPGGTTRKRPKVGDKDPNYKPPKKKAPPTKREKPAPKKKVKSPLVQRNDSEGRPVGKGGEARSKSIDKKVERMQTGKRY